MSGGDDTITGTSATLNSDIIVDGSATDSDTLTLTGAAFATAINSTGSTIAGVENINVNFDALTAATFDMAGVADAPAVTVSNTRSGATSLVTVSNVKSGTVINAGTGLAGGLTVTMSAADLNVTTNSTGVTGTTTVTTTGTGTITANSGTDALTLSSANGAITVAAAGAATGTLSAIATGSGVVSVTANSATATVTGQSATGNVTVNAAAAATVNATATAATAVANAAAATAINATGTSITVTSANVGTTAAPTVIGLTGTTGTADAATVTANGVVTLTNNANLESLNLSGNTAAVTYNIAASETVTVSGTQNVTIGGTAAILAASTITDSSTGTSTASITTDAAGSDDFSTLTVDVISHAVAAGAANTYTYRDGQAVTWAVNPGFGITLDIDDDAAGTTTVGTLNVTLSANTTSILTVENTGDDIDTLNVTASIAQTALDIRADNTATTGDTINVLGSRAVVFAAGTTALALNGSSATGAITATASANILTVSGGSAADTLVLTANVANSSVSGNAGNDGITVNGTHLATQSVDGGDGTDTVTVGGATDVSAGTFTNVEIVAQGANTFQLSSAQAVSGLVFTGTGAVTIDDLAASVDFSGLIFSDAAGNTVISAANTNSSIGAAAARTFIGTDAIDLMTGGDGADVLSGGAGADILIGGDGADALIGGLGNNTYRYLLASTADTGETITFNTTTGATETIDVDSAANNVTVDLSAVNAGALLTGLDAISIGAGDTATFAGAQITGLTLAVTGGAGSTLAVTGTTSADTINLSAATVTTAVVTIAGGTGADTIVGSSGNDTITGGVGADTLTGGAGANTYVMLVADAGDTITDFDVTVTTGDVIDYNTTLVAIGGANNLVYQDDVAGVALGATTTVFELEGSTTGGTAANLVTALGATAVDATIDAGDTLLFVNYLTAGGAQVWSFVDANGADVDAAELTLLVTLTGVAADAVLTTNFV